MRDFVIDGCGRVARTGDRVFVRPLRMSEEAGFGVIKSVLSEVEVMVRLDSGTARAFLISQIKREDDTDESGGLPLWCWR